MVKRRYLRTLQVSIIGLNGGDSLIVFFVAPAAAHQFNEDALNQLQGMGFSLHACQRALLATGNADAETAMNWLFSHMDDAGSLS